MKERGRQLVMGDGIKMRDVLGTNDQILVCSVQGQKYSSSGLKKWVVQVWGQALVNLPSMLTMTRVWFSLSISSLEHAKWVLSKF